MIMNDGSEPPQAEGEGGAATVIREREMNRTATSTLTFDSDSPRSSTLESDYEDADKPVISGSQEIHPSVVKSIVEPELVLLLIYGYCTPISL